MASEAEQVKTEDENKTIRKDGVRLFGYTLPWTVLLVVLLLVLYLAYSRGMLGNLIGNATPTEITVGPTVDVGSPVDQTSEIKQALNAFATGRYSKGRW